MTFLNQVNELKPNDHEKSEFTECFLDDSQFSDSRSPRRYEEGVGESRSETKLPSRKVTAPPLSFKVAGDTAEGEENGGRRE